MFDLRLATMRLFLCQALVLRAAGHAFDSRPAGASVQRDPAYRTQQTPRHTKQVSKAVTDTSSPVDALQQLPPRWRPLPPRIPFTTDPAVVESEKVKYVEMIVKHLDMMKAESDDEIRGMELQSEKQKAHVAEQIHQQLRYKEDQLAEEHHRALVALHNQKEAQKAELQKKANQLKAPKLDALENKFDEQFNMLNSTHHKQRLLVTEVQRVYETRFDDTAKLLDEYETDLARTKQEFNMKAHEMMEAKKEEVRRQIADRSPHMFD